MSVLTESQIVSRGTRRPRLHDLRHTLAVHRLYQWYAEEGCRTSFLCCLPTLGMSASTTRRPTFT